MKEVVKINSPASSQSVTTLAESLLVKNLRESMSDNTIKAYRSRLLSFAEWCESCGLPSRPAAPLTVALFIEHLKEDGRKVSTINQYVAAISKDHVISGLDDPCKDIQVKAAVKAAARTLGTAPAQKTAITSEILANVLSAITEDGLKAKRDKALLSVGFFGAFRRSELAALKASDAEKSTDKDGSPVILLHVRKSKTDQTGAGEVKVLFSGSHAANVVGLLSDWIASSGVTGDDPLFQGVTKYGTLSGKALSGFGIATIIKERVGAINADLVETVSGHSLRRGFVTSAVAAGCSERSIMHQTGHKSVQMVRRYIERYDITNDNAAAAL